jgi:hypothetical protein
MGILFPLYLLGLLGLAAPIFFHFRQKQTKDITKFSSLIFLETAPIKQRTQSQIQHWLLLFVRCLILALLALAFARPLFRSAIGALGGDDPEKVVILVDRSASMRRDGVWDKAVAKLEEVLDTLKDDDLVQVSVYDSKVVPVMMFEEAVEIGGARNDAILEAVKKLEPSWESTDLGRALVFAVEGIEAGVEKGDEVDEESHLADASGRVVVISDAQDGADIEQLKAFLWPEDVSLDFETVGSDKPTNASIQLLPAPKGLQQNKSGRSFRIENGESSELDVFKVRWRNADGTIASEEMLVKVPPGETEILRTPATSTGLPAPILELTGDDHDFDNRSYTEAVATMQLRVLYVGTELDDDPLSARFFLRRALFPTRTMVPELTAKLPDDTFEADVLRLFDLIVVAGNGALPNAGRFAEYVEQGGRMLYLMHDAAAAEGLGQVLGVDALVAQEGQVKDYVLLGSVNRRHPLLSAFAEARFGDFSNVHFWKYRKLDPDQIPGVSVLGQFDNGDPAWLLKSKGKGSVLAFTSSWKREDSQLALSTKFIPLLYAILSNQPEATEKSAIVHVGEPFPVTAAPAAQPAEEKTDGSEAPRPGEPDGESPAPSPHSSRVSITYPSGITVPLIDGEDVFRKTIEPGLYTVKSGAFTSVVAVNLDPKESELELMDTEVLRKMIEPREVEEETAGTGARADEADKGEEKNRAKDLKREKRQRVWRILVFAVLIFVLFEIWYSAYCRRKEIKSQETGG